MNLPETARRLFAHVPAVAADASAKNLIVGRLLEEGDSGDLCWLVEEVGEETVADWVRERGGRQLSCRSRRFWERVLRVEAAMPAEVGEELWPL